MIKSYKVRLEPNNRQKSKLFANTNVSRFAYNWALNKQIKHFKLTGKLNKISDGNLRKELTQLKKSGELKWLYDYSCNIPKQAIKDCCKAIDRFHKESKKNGYKYREGAIKSGRKLNFTDFIDFPRFKNKKKSIPSFYNDVCKISFTSNYVILEVIGKIKLSEKDRIPYENNIKYINPRITFDGLNWFISIGVEIENIKPKLNDFSVGIDLGVKDLAIVSNFDKPFKNINKTKRVKRINKRLNKLQRQVSRKYDINKIETTYKKTNNIVKLETKINKLHKRLTNIRTDYKHKITTEIVKTKPCRIVMEDLNIKGMIKNKHLAKTISEQGLYEVQTFIQYKSERDGIEFIKADRWYPSSKTCSYCGHVKKKLSLSDRIFVCECCGNKIDRDKNASINLSRYNYENKVS